MQVMNDGELGVVKCLNCIEFFYESRGIETMHVFYGFNARK